MDIPRNKKTIFFVAIFSETSHACKFQLALTSSANKGLGQTKTDHNGQRKIVIDKENRKHYKISETLRLYWNRISAYYHHHHYYIAYWSSHQAVQKIIAINFNPVKQCRKLSCRSWCSRQSESRVVLRLPNHLLEKRKHD